MPIVSIHKSSQDKHSKCSNRDNIKSPLAQMTVDTCPKNLTIPSPKEQTNLKNEKTKEKKRKSSNESKTFRTRCYPWLKEIAWKMNRRSRVDGSPGFNWSWLEYRQVLMESEKNGKWRCKKNWQKCKVHGRPNFRTLYQELRDIDNLYIFKCYNQKHIKISQR